MTAALLKPPEDRERVDCRIAINTPRRLRSCRYTLSPILAGTSLLYSDAGRMLAATSFVDGLHTAARVGPLQFDRLGSRPWPPGIHLIIIFFLLPIIRESPKLWAIERKDSFQKGFVWKEQVPVRPRGPAPAWGVVSSRDCSLFLTTRARNTVKSVCLLGKKPQRVARGSTRIDFSGKF